MAAEPRRGADGFARDLPRMRDQFRQSAPAYDSILGHVQAMLDQPRSPLGDALERAWNQRTFHVHYDRPLLFLAALRADALEEGESHPLFDVIGPRPTQKLTSAEAVERSLGPDRTRFFQLLSTRRVQTNETLRSVGWRWAAWLAGCDGGARPLALVDLGASAGLNLVAERLPAAWTFPDGAPVPVVRSVRAVVRLGLDARPVDLRDAEAVVWMRACIWPGDDVRLERLEAALQAFRDAEREGEGPVLERRDVNEFPARVLRVSEETGDAFVLAYQSYLRDYLSPDVRRAYRDDMHAWLAAAPYGRALWATLEAANPPDERLPPAAMSVHFRTYDGGVRELELARMGHHPTAVTADSGALLALQQVLRPDARGGT